MSHYSRRCRESASNNNEEHTGREIRQTVWIGLLEAATYGHAQGVNFLLKKQRKLKNSIVRESFEASCFGGPTFVVSVLLQVVGKDTIKKLANRGLNASASNGHTGLAVYLIGYLLSICKEAVLTRLLIAAIGNGRFYTVQALLQWWETWGDLHYRHRSSLDNHLIQWP
ncbi:hypothetical protein HD806DRAFT_552029 [Xylariaceae sp. AK1471]|nr:hypothetical protein HD806DRAFT_552029 [Xylariaceae sp. AK1471]